MPPKHQVTKNHKRLSIIVIALVEFSVLELWWQVFTFWSGLKIQIPKLIPNYMSS
jgi:hypothetical protein